MLLQGSHKGDVRDKRLREQGWTFHSNYDSREKGALEEVLKIFPACFGEEILILNSAYDVFGREITGYKAVFYRGFDTALEKASRKGW